MTAIGTRFSRIPSTQYAAMESKLLRRDVWRVMETFKYHIADPASGQYVTIPRGYLTDGASVPAVLWSVIPPWGAYGAAAIVHDILCEYLRVMRNGVCIYISRRRADEILLEAMKDLQVDEEQCSMIYTGVVAYRKIFSVDEPNWQKDKAALEAKWVSDNPI